MAGISEAAHLRPLPYAPDPSELLALILAGPDRPLHGTITTHVEGGDRLSGTGWMAYTPLTTTVRDQSRLDVWRDGPRLRVQHPDGSPALIVGTESAWRFDDDIPIEVPRLGAADPFVAVDLLTQGLLSGATDRAAGVHLESYIFHSGFLGRVTWAATLWRPDGLEPVQLQIDLGTGAVLSKRTKSGSVVEWTELVVGEAPDPALFTWDGPVR